MAQGRRNPRRGQPAPRAAPGWLWFLAGGAVGFLAAGLTGLDLELPAALQPGGATPPVQQAAGAGAADAAGGGKPRTKPHFEFYTILPEMEVQVPEQEIASRPGQAAAQEPVQGQGSYVLQVGSFRHLEEADRLKASLALLGLEAEIQTVSVSGEETWHRVRLGPFTDLERLNATRKRLRENGLQAMVLKIKA